jgi:uncharacterized protein
LAEAQTAPESRPQEDALGAPWGLSGTVVALLIALAVDLIGTIVGSFAVYLAGGSTHTLASLPFEIMFYQFLVLGVTIAAFVVVGRYKGGAAALGFRFPGWGLLLRTAGAALPILVLGVYVLSLLFATLFPEFKLSGNTNAIFGTAPRHMALGLKIVVFLWAALEAPLAEETLFRGILFQGLRHSFNRWLPYRWSVLGGALVSGAVFGSAHLAGGELHTLPLLIFLGIVLAYVFQMTRSLYASALVHGIINGVSVIVFLVGR